MLYIKCIAIVKYAVGVSTRRRRYFLSPPLQVHSTSRTALLNTCNEPSERVCIYRQGGFLFPATNGKTFTVGEV